MTVTARSLGIDKLNVNDRLALVEEIWAGICADPSEFCMSPEQRAELDRRVADDDRSPDDVIPWDEVVGNTRTRTSR